MYEYNATITRVVDGDTFEVSVDLGFGVSIQQTLRLSRIDAYETRLGGSTTAEEKAKGIEAREAMKALFEEDPRVVVNTLKDSTGKYGRYLAEVTHNGVNINDLLVEKGYAVYS